MTVAPGSRLGPYEVISLVGAGGMGEVYKATDTRLNRTVAIKVLPPHWADNPEMRQRFDQEAQTIASLNHPHICTLHDIGREGDTDFLVMEYVEGETLAQRIERGAMPLNEVLKVALAIADALDKAHREGVVHRDLKPSNVMLSQSGVKLLDFGLAKGKTEKSQLGLKPISATTPGTLIGTLQYMAPEQLEGVEADARTDIFAFGAVLYEMVTGKRAFEGKTQPLLMAAIVSLELDPLSSSNPGTPPALDHLAKRCLAKNPENRWQTAHSLMVQLQWIAAGGSGEIIPVGLSPEQQKKASRKRILLGIAAVAIAAMVGPVFLYLRGAPEPEEVTFRVPVEGLSSENIAVSPDGKTMALVIQPDTSGPSSLYVRPVGSLAYRKLAGTTDALQPFWSPDNRFIAFVAGSKLKTVEMTGGAPKDITDAPEFFGGSWSREGTIVFGSSKGLFRVSAEGGKAEPLTTLDKPETAHFWPNFLPDGQHYIYTAWSADAGSRAIYAGTLASKEKTKLMAAESNAAYAAPGYLVFHRDTTIFAQPFDAGKLKLEGKPIHVADQLAFNPANGLGSFNVSHGDANKVLIYFQGANATAAGRGQTVTRQFAWRNRTGQIVDLAGEQGQYGDMDLSPDGKLLAVTRQEAGATTADIWVIDWQRGVPIQVTRNSGDNVNPVWSPDGKRIAFTSYRKGNADVFVKNADGVGEDMPLLESSSNESVEGWSRDGKFLLYLSGQDAFQDIYALPMSREGKPDGKPIPVITGHYRKDEPQLSDDGKWLAYASDKSGMTFQVYVTSFPAPDQEIQISMNGGGQPRWKADGKELYYRGPDSTVMAVDFKPGPKIEATTPRLLFPTTQANSNPALNPTRHQWAVAPDGQRFLLPVANGQAPRGRGTASGAPTVQGGTYTPPGQTGQTAALGRGSGISTGLTVIQHWTSGLAKEVKETP